jgi:hypothetical protein
MMGFDPDQNKLMIEATRRGFGDPAVEIIGEATVTKFRPAISSFMDEKPAREFPNLLALAGHVRNGAPGVTDKDKVTPENALALEQACSGGCLAAAKTGLDYYNYKKNARRDFALCVIEGEGILIGGERYWFDKTGKPYTIADIAALPMRKLALGNCAMTAKSVSQFVATGCCDPAKCMSVVCRAAGVAMPIMSLKNKALLQTVFGMVKTVLARKRHIAAGRYVDCPTTHEDRIYGLPILTPEDEKKDFIPWPLPPMTVKEKAEQLKNQWDIVKSACDSGMGEVVQGWQIAGYSVTILLWIGAILLSILSSWHWLAIGLLLLHLAELFLIGIKTGRKTGMPAWKYTLFCMLFGFIWWLPLRDN